jgi:hypothetical protein
MFFDWTLRKEPTYLQPCKNGREQAILLRVGDAWIDLPERLLSWKYCFLIGRSQRPRTIRSAFGNFPLNSPRLEFGYPQNSYPDK